MCNVSTFLFGRHLELSGKLILRKIINKCTPCTIKKRNIMQIKENEKELKCPVQAQVKNFPDMNLLFLFIRVKQYIH